MTAALDILVVIRTVATRFPKDAASCRALLIDIIAAAEHALRSLDKETT